MAGPEEDQARISLDFMPDPPNPKVPGNWSILGSSGSCYLRQHAWFSADLCQAWNGHGGCEGSARIRALTAVYHAALNIVLLEEQLLRGGDAGAEG